MSSSSSNLPDPKQEASEQQLQEAAETDQIKDRDSEAAHSGEGEGDEAEEEEEEGECGFCLFMKGGGCKDAFIGWEKCVEEAEKNKEDIVDKCFQATSNLKKCMEAHADYYEPVLKAEKAAAEEDSTDESEKKSDEQTATPDLTPPPEISEEQF